MSYVYDKLGTTKEIQSIMIPSSDEKVLLEEIMNGDEGGWNDEDDVVVDGWTKLLVEKKKTIFFEKLYNEDVASRVIVDNPDADNVVREIVGSGRVARKRKKVSNDGLVELENRLMAVFENGFKEIHKKIDAQDKRLQVVELNLKWIKENVVFVEEDVVEVGHDGVSEGNEVSDDGVSERNEVSDDGVSERNEVSDDGVSERNEVSNDASSKEKETGEGKEVGEDESSKDNETGEGSKGKDVGVGEDGEPSNKRTGMTYERKRNVKRGRQEDGVVRSPIVTRQRK
ncbi:hypothetical protein V5N11_010723 [Cardamine amara subsp. amara]|uniref:DUF287 domain-containing protein n=1 Tax=Cardamine amara subsp. amara TaxID=228776 RepID=A0ABD0ZP94_CARAN